ncbi:palmitoyl protein thioesterase-domain-containing protein [Jimgerdemannia flammicorona]|uniref:Palmitoyl-protein thioesterase 1 n=1 Tax=Jimgerdemannia flammicorona TaxID=994334 RepID=A0A433B057_9FUNG|nr:palmitoyl protein thioesterase-domain-containing protein [Jimgerdemannia flammicorona]
MRLLSFAALCFSAPLFQGEGGPLFSTFVAQVIDKEPSIHPSRSHPILPSHAAYADKPPAYKPVVLWHGMGDSCCNPESMGKIKSTIEQLLPGTYVYSVRIGDTDKDDQNSGFFGNLNQQVDQVCQQLRENKKLRDGFNAVGFSQGGLFLRYVVASNVPSKLGPLSHVCLQLTIIQTFHTTQSNPPPAPTSNDATTPRFTTLSPSAPPTSVRLNFLSSHCAPSLPPSPIPNSSTCLSPISVSPTHIGASDIPGCADPADTSCRLMRSVVRRGAYASYVRDHVIQAQYFKDPDNIETYLANNIFLPDINNELAVNKTYARRLSSLHHLVLIRFTEDVTLKPAESSVSNRTRLWGCCAWATCTGSGSTTSSAICSPSRSSLSGPTTSSAFAVSPNAARRKIPASSSRSARVST